MSITINGENKFLRLTLLVINIIAILGSLSTAFGLYYSFKARLEKLERQPISFSVREQTQLSEQVVRIQRAIDDEIKPKLTQVAGDTAWLVARTPNGPKR